MTFVKLIGEVHMRELLRLRDWLARYDTMEHAAVLASGAMARLLYMACQCQATPEGPFERLYWEAWTLRSQHVSWAPGEPFSAVEYSVPWPHVEHLTDLCVAYGQVAAYSVLSNLTLTDLLKVMDATARYRFNVRDLYEMIDCLDGPLETSRIISSATRAEPRRADVARAARTVGARLTGEEIVKATKWLEFHGMQRLES